MNKLSLLSAALIISLTTAAQKMDSVKYDNGFLYYHEYGSGEPIILLTGGPGNSYLQLEELSVSLGKSYRSILLEQRGTGRSVPKPLDATTITLQSAIDDLNLLMSHLKIKQAIILGHSWGGILAMSYAASNPDKVKALILSGPGPYKFKMGNLTTDRMHIYAKYTPAEAEKGNSLLRILQKGQGTHQDSIEVFKFSMLPWISDKSRIDELAPRLRPGPRNETTNRLMMSNLDKINFDLTESLANYKGPVDVITGRDDPLNYYTLALQKLRPQITIHWVEKSGHFTMYEQPEVFYGILVKILPELKPKPGQQQ